MNSFSLSGGVYDWYCLGVNGGTFVNCGASEERCGDTSLDAGNYANQSNVVETCDDGNDTSGDGCDSLCHLEPLSCSISPNPSWALPGENIQVNISTNSWIQT